MWAMAQGEVIHIDPAGDNTVDTYIGTGSNTTATGYYTRKWFAPQATGDMSSGLNIIMFRYADILLMWAEAKLEQNQMTADVWNSTVRAIRQRAGFKTAKALNFPADKSQAELRQILRNGAAASWLSKDCAGTTSSAGRLVQSISPNPYVVPALPTTFPGSLRSMRTATTSGLFLRVRSTSILT